MTTLAANKPRAFELGERNHLPVIDNDIIYEGAAVGIVDASGHARPLNAADRFAGFAVAQADNTGIGHAAAAINVEVVKSGEIELAVTGAVITDVGNPVYATDDDTFSLSPVGGAFIGFVKRFVSSGVAVVDFDAGCYRDPWAAFSVRETVAGALTLDIEDNGKLFVVTADAGVITLPAVATPVNCVIMNGGAFGTVLVSISPDANDKIRGPNIAGTNNKDLLNTKATARRGDFARLVVGDADGPFVAELRGTWATEG